MKPTQTKFPNVDCNYHSIALDELPGQCATGSSNYWRFSREYFNTEARSHFRTEAAVFVAIMITALIPLVNGAETVLNLCRFYGAFNIL